MPRYSRAYRGRRRTRRPRRPRGVRRTATAAAKRVVSTLSETKTFDSIGSGSMLIVENDLLSAISVGTGGTNREGNKTVPTSLDLRYTLVPNASTTNDYVRVMLVRFRGLTSTADIPGIDDVLEDTSVAAHYGVISAYNYANRSSYSVLYDRVHRMNANVGPLYTRKMLYGKQIGGAIRFDGAANGAFNHLWLFFVPASGGTNSPTFNFRTRMTFKDL